MGCNCGGRNKKWYYVAPDGTETVFSTEIQAMAMKVRANGEGEVVKK